MHSICLKISVFGGGIVLLIYSTVIIKDSAIVNSERRKYFPLKLFS